jgi:hypothetical protein
VRRHKYTTRPAHPPDATAGKRRRLSNRRGIEGRTGVTYGRERRSRIDEGPVHIVCAVSRERLAARIAHPALCDNALHLGLGQVAERADLSTAHPVAPVIRRVSQQPGEL